LVVTFEPRNVSWGIAVGKISGDAWGSGNIEESEVVNIWVSFEEKG
jgi:hypothetical protein